MRGFGTRLIAVALATVTATAGVTAATSHTPVAALDGSEFVSGNIISDALFYDSAAMTETEIQSFLNSKVGACDNGRCLNVISVPVASRSAAYANSTGQLECSAFQGGTLRAAAIIFRVQQACGISAKVILVTLEKEQGLVTSSSPSQYALDRAMGMACPDTAPCASYALGLGNQIYEGTKQLKVYKAAGFARQPGLHSIAYHPNVACGASTIRIENYATAALYNYTPYQPNAAALANLGGVGDSCSSYGNRNFWFFYRSWFGSTQGVPPGTFDGPAAAYGLDADGHLFMYGANANGGWRSRLALGPGWSDYVDVTGAGDVGGDGHRDLLALDATGVLWTYPTDGLYQLGDRVEVATGLSDTVSLLPVTDVTGDGRADLLTIDNVGGLWLHPFLTGPTLGAPRQVGSGWSVMTAVIAVPDFNGDHRVDLMSRDVSGRLWLYPGAALGAFGKRVQIGNGWAGMVDIFSPGDFNSDGRVDMMGRDASGFLWFYPGNGSGGFSGGGRVGQGWDGFVEVFGPGPAAVGSFVVQPGAGDLSADGARDVLAVDPTGRLFLYQGDGRGGWRGALVLVGDWGGSVTFGNGDADRDGMVDVFRLDVDGSLNRYALTGPSLLSDPEMVAGEVGWDVYGHVFGAGDVDGDGDPDVLAILDDGTLWLHSGDGAGGFQPGVRAGHGWDVMDAVITAGDFDGDGRADLLARSTTGALYLYAGDGSGGWLAGRQVGSGWGGFDVLFSPGDFDGDGKGDVLARTPGGLLYLYRGNGVGGWFGGSVVGRGWQSFTSLG